MKTLLSVGLIVGLVLGSGCASHKHPELHGLDTLDNLVNVIGNLQSAAIQLEASKQLSQTFTFQIVSYTNLALKTIRDARSDWREAVLTATDALLARPELKRFRVELVTIEDLVQAIK